MPPYLQQVPPEAMAERVSHIENSIFSKRQAISARLKGNPENRLQINVIKGGKNKSAQRHKEEAQSTDDFVITDNNAGGLVPNYQSSYMEHIEKHQHNDNDQ